MKLLIDYLCTIKLSKFIILGTLTIFIGLYLTLLLSIKICIDYSVPTGLIIGTLFGSLPYTFVLYIVLLRIKQNK